MRKGKDPQVNPLVFGEGLLGERMTGKRETNKGWKRRELLPSHSICKTVDYHVLKVVTYQGTPTIQLTMLSGQK